MQDNSRKSRRSESPESASGSNPVAPSAVRIDHIRVTPAANSAFSRLERDAQAGVVKTLLAESLQMTPIRALKGKLEVRMPHAIRAIVERHGSDVLAHAIVQKKDWATTLRTFQETPPRHGRTLSFAESALGAFGKESSAAVARPTKLGQYEELGELLQTHLAQLAKHVQAIVDVQELTTNVNDTHDYLHHELSELARAIGIQQKENEAIGQLVQQERARHAKSSGQLQDALEELRQGQNDASGQRDLISRRLAEADRQIAAIQARAEQLVETQTRCEEQLEEVQNQCDRKARELFGRGHDELQELANTQTAELATLRREQIEADERENNLRRELSQLTAMSQALADRLAVVERRGLFRTLVRWFAPFRPTRSTSLSMASSQHSQHGCQS